MNADMTPMMTLRKSRKTTQVRAFKPDVAVLDEIVSMLCTISPDVHYTRSDAINWLIEWARFHGHITE